MSQEQIIGIILNHPNEFETAREILAGADFTKREAYECWQLMESMRENSFNLDANAVIRGLNNFTAEWCMECKDRAFSPNVEPYAVLLFNENKKANFEHAMSIAMIQDDPPVFIENALHELNTTKTNKSITFKQLIGETCNAIENTIEGGGGIKCGLRSIDDLTGGLQDSRVVIVAARTSQGKTALTLQMALFMGKAGINVGICSLEMSSSELGLRSISHISQTNISSLTRGEDYALQSMSEAIAKQKFADWNIHFNTDQYQLQEIISQIRAWVRRDDVKIAYVDHIGLIEVKEAKSANERLGIITRAMKKLAKELDIPIVLVSQLNRANDKENRLPRLSDLRDSGSIEQDADIVILLHRVMDGNNYVKHELIMAKNRQGSTGVIDAIVEFNGGTQTFTEKTNGY